MTSSGTEITIPIQGVEVKFPCNPYPSQLTMMERIIKCINRKQNSLLESPTGSGKSLALLCSSLAWLMAEKEKINQYMLVYQLELEELERSVGDEEDSSCCSTPLKEEKVDNLPSEKMDSLPLEKSDRLSSLKIEPSEKMDTSSLIPDIKDELASEVHVQPVNHSDTTKSDCKDKDSGSKEEDIIDNIIKDDEFSEDADFQPPKKRFRTPGMQSLPTAKKHRSSSDGADELADFKIDDGASKNPPEWTMKLTRPMKEECCTDNKKEMLIDNVKENKKDFGNETKKFDVSEFPSESAPQIFFGTRTHKQITQIVREMNKTEYKTTKMCILASREHTCIHSDVSKSKNKTEDCRKSVEGREGMSCGFHAKSHLIKDRHLQQYGIKKAWDIEELVGFGEHMGVCPYYTSRELMKEADIIFCPYNYLIDPIIRSQMDIDLTDQIVILDEAHNIEDSSRDAASWCVTTNQLDDAIKDLDYFVTHNIYREQHQVLHSVCANVRRWIVNKSEHLKDVEFEKCSKVWSGNELLKALEELGFTPISMPILTKHFNKIMSPKDQSNIKREYRPMRGTTTSLFEGLFMVLHFLLKDNYKYLCDYRVAIIKKPEMANTEQVLPGGWRRKGAFKKQWVYTLNFWCLSPAVAFSEIGSNSRSVILTSGTLSPMSSFSSELGVSFPIQLEANHVIGPSQVWVSTLSVGPAGSALNATFRFTETYSFQDEVGEAIHNVCQVVPYGVLCFFPSYSMLDKLMQRWKITGLWARLSKLKRTFYEPRRGDKADFNDMMDHFYNVIKVSEEADDESPMSGALFLAVCRGKVSEGLDFADNNARAVITVGIPFPNVKDTQVELKRKYNNQYCSEKGLLNGSEWYEIQAYRALNQALGRCIRHKHDWGAILLIDERFGKSPKYRNGLSKWIRNKVVHHNNFQHALTSLKQFATARLENPSPTDTPGRTLCKTPGKPMDIEETKHNLESPISVSSHSQSTQSPDTTPTARTDLAESKPAGHILTPIPKDPQMTKTPSSVPFRTGVTQVTPQLSSNRIVASTPIAAHVLVPKNLYLTTLNNVQTTLQDGGSNVLGTAGGRSLHQGIAGGNNVQQGIAGDSSVHQGIACGGNLQGNAINTINKIVILPLLSPNALVSPAGSSIRPGVVLGQHVRFGTQQLMLGSQRNEGSHLPGGTTQIGNATVLQNVRLVQMSQASYVRPLTDVGVINRNGVEVEETKSQGERRLQKRPMFAVQRKVTNNEGSLDQDKEGLENQSLKVGGENIRSKEECNNKDVKKEDGGKVALSCIDTNVSSPGSPLLFVDSPASVENNDDVMETNQLVREGAVSADGAVVKTDEEVEDMDTGDKTGIDMGTGDKTVTEKTVEDSKGETVKSETKEGHDAQRRAQGISCGATSVDNDKISACGPVCTRGKDLLDMVDCEEDENVSNDVTWNLNCLGCNCTFLSDDAKPTESDIPSDSIFGGILGTLFSLNSTRRKREDTLKTVSIGDFNKVQGCCSALSCSKGKNIQRDVKLNSIFVEEESRCYVPLVCSQCEESRKSRSRARVVAVRAVDCGNEIQQGKSEVWFLQDKVHLNSSTQDVR